MSKPSPASTCGALLPVLIATATLACRPESRPLPSHPAKATAQELSRMLESAIQQNDLQGVQQALSGGANPNAPLPGEDWTPLARAVMKENVNTVRILLAAGADPKRKVQPNNEAWPIVFLAASVDSPDVLREVVRAGADPNSRARLRGEITPLGLAAHDGAVNSCGLLPELGADVDAWNLWPDSVYGSETFRPGERRGRTALMIAASRGHRDCVEQLLLRRADPGLRNERGENAADLVREYRSPIPSILEALHRPRVPASRLR